MNTFYVRKIFAILINFVFIFLRVHFFFSGTNFFSIIQFYFLNPPLFMQTDLCSIVRDCCIYFTLLFFLFFIFVRFFFSLLSWIFFIKYLIIDLDSDVKRFFCHVTKFIVKWIDLKLQQTFETKWILTNFVKNC